MSNWLERVLYAVRELDESTAAEVVRAVLIERDGERPAGLSARAERVLARMDAAIPREGGK